MVSIALWEDHQGNISRRTPLEERMTVHVGVGTTLVVEVCVEVLVAVVVTDVVCVIELVCKRR